MELKNCCRVASFTRPKRKVTSFAEEKHPQIGEGVYSIIHGVEQVVIMTPRSTLLFLLIPAEDAFVGVLVRYSGEVHI